jgi:hypothetical protein
MNTCLRCRRPHRSTREICYTCRSIIATAKRAAAHKEIGRHVGELLWELIWRRQ